jgi:hypothetical protein
MATDDFDPADLSSLKDPPYTELPQDDLVTSQMQAGEPELDDHGVPVQDRSAKGRIWLQETACLICGAACFGLALIDYNGDNSRGHLAGYQAVLAFLPGILAFVLIGFLDQEKNKKHIGGVGKTVMWTGLLVTILGICGLLVFTWHLSP